MPRIRGWKLNRWEQSETYRVYDSTVRPRAHLIIENTHTLDKGVVPRGIHWRAYTNLNTSEDFHKYFRTKAGAIKFAVNWMKKHPRG